MNSFDCQKNIKEPIEYRPIIADTAAECPDGLLITTVAVMTAGTFFGLKGMGFGQHDALLMSTSLLWLMSLPI